MKPQPVVDRIQAELSELKSRAFLLSAFIEKGMPHVSTDEEKDLLREQLSVQSRYVEILERRLVLP